jgi:arylsulfatase A-like enzyme
MPRSTSCGVPGDFQGVPAAHEAGQLHHRRGAEEDGADRGLDRIPRYNGNIPFENGFLSEMLQQHGYNTYAVGKWHLTPADQIRRPGPTTAGRWAAASSVTTAFWAARRTSTIPDLVYDNHQVEAAEDARGGLPPDRGPGGQGDQLHRRRQAGGADKPFFMYFCPGAMHAPHHVPKEWADKYKGQFDDGWDATAKRCFAAEGAGHHPGRCRAVPPRPGCPSGTRFRRTRGSMPA